MDDRLTRIRTAINDLRGRIEVGKAAIAERDALRERFERLRVRFEALRNADNWAELSIGANIAIGDEAIYFRKRYVCVKAHSKSLLRLPTNDEYWEEVSENDSGG